MPANIQRDTATYEVDIKTPVDTDDPVPTAKDVEESIEEGLLKRNMRGLKVDVVRL